jgi:16S rRNA C967 or C1407 C5-methylase (RsmB/RsmF family)/NOL1/NOP2/fmu family ribosome biogenesis protein
VPLCAFFSQRHKGTIDKSSEGPAYIWPMSLPQQLLRSLEGVEGFDSNAFEAVHASGEQVTSIRLHPIKSSMADGRWPMDRIPWCPYGRYLFQRPSFTLDPLFHAGAYYVQEASSMFLWHVLKETVGNDTPKKVLDLCAAPGGKTTLLASYFTEGLIVANEVIKARAAVLVENLTKWGSSQVIVTNNDPSHFQSLPGYFDVMVVDAPCSGSGLFRKDPGAIAEWSEDNVQLCSQRQQRILADVLPALKEDGILIYSTCSYSVEEDEAIADWLLTEMDMECKALPLPADWGIVETRSALNGAYGYRFYPDKVKGEGLFIAVFQKKAVTENTRLKVQSLQLPTKQEEQLLNGFIELPAAWSLFKQGDAVRGIQKQWLGELQILAKCLYIKKAGIEIGTIKGKDVIPSHELALSLLPLDTITGLELTEAQALQYLRRKELVLTAPTGWTLVKYCGLPLGWIKVLPNRINNYYPAEWRILKE